MRRVARFVVRPLVIGPVVLVLVAGTIGAIAVRARQSKPATWGAATIDAGAMEPDTRFHVRLPDPTPTPTPPPPTPKPKPTPKPVKRTVTPNISAFRGLGAWVDLYDYDALDVESSLADMAAHGVRTLYLQTARWNKPAADDDRAMFQDPVVTEHWLTAAHARGMKVVGWYLPAYDDMTRDLRRTRAIAEYRSAGGQRFDALAIDIEFKQQMPSLTEWNAAVADHARRVRKLIGSRYPMAAIVPAPLAMEVRPEHWVGFPWQSLAAVSDLFMPMAYWSFRDDCPDVPEHCAYGYTKGNVERVRELTGRPHVPVHVVGGVGDEITVEEVGQFVRGANNVEVYGASLYDYQTTTPEFWRQLAKLD